MAQVWVDLGDGPEAVDVPGMDRAQWSRFLDAADLSDEDAIAPDLIAHCTGWDIKEAQEAWDEWPTDAAHALLAACTAGMPSVQKLQWARDRIRADAYLELELAVTETHGIPLSEFHQWDERDQDLALAAHIEARDRCPRCGMPSHSLRDPSLGHLTAVQCVHCARLDATRDDIPDDQRAHTHLGMTCGGHS